MPTRTFPGYFSSLASIAAFIEKEAEAAGLTDQDVYSVQLAVDEACSNIIEHSYGGEGIGDIQCTCERRPDGLQIILVDHGKRFDPDAIPGPDVGAPLEELGSRGAGVFLMKKLMDLVKFEFDEEQGTTLTMLKKKGD